MVRSNEIYSFTPRVSSKIDSLIDKCDNLHKVVTPSTRGSEVVIEKVLKAAKTASSEPEKNVSICQSVIPICFYASFDSRQSYPNTKLDKIIYGNMFPSNVLDYSSITSLFKFGTSSVTRDPSRHFHSRWTHTGSLDSIGSFTCRTSYVFTGDHIIRRFWPRLRLERP